MKYEKFDSKTNQVLHTASTTFQNSMCRIMNRNETNPLHLISLKDRIVSHSPIGYFARDNSIPFTKWIVNKENREVYSLECVFGCNQITDDMVNVIESIIVYIESQITEGTSTRDQIFQYWKDDIDFIRSSNIERDFVKEFKEMTNNHNINTNTVKLIIEKTRIGSKYILKDWVDLLKILLLEMPDSVVPITLQQEFSQQKEYEWLEMISIEKLKILEIFANHFNQIGDIDLLFKDQRDIPFIQFFSRVRGFGQNIITSTSTISNIVLRLLKDHIKDITSAINNKKIKKPENENQVPMITVNRERSNSVMQGSGKTGLLKSAALTLPSNNIREHKRSISMTVLSSGLKTLVHEGKEEGDSFVPLPFKTTSTPGSPSQLTNAQKRKSGLNLLTPSTENLD